MRGRTEWLLAAILIGLLVAGFLVYRDRLGGADLPNPQPIQIPQPDLG